ncbi:MAG: ATP-dependent 6-phosphofructokinase [Desulfomonile sp.]|jgi:6-phosphofructokinase 1|nr:ATP-dependent 6-phosphofructokinase [Deltaproteobacteria bacterium]
MDTTIETLGEPKIDSPLGVADAVDDHERILFNISAETIEQEVREERRPVSFMKAGPRAKIFFDTSKLKCAVVTCGGLCPGLNNVIRSVVLTLYHTYGVKNILGIRYGLQGFIAKYGHPVMELTPEKVSEINELGGTILSSSRGPQNIEEIVDALERMNVGILFAVGGDGTFRAAAKITEELRNRGSKIAIVGIPKTIDNDINLLSRSFGFNTAVSMATQAVGAAHVEANGAPNGIGLVKLMGRDSGFIAASAALDKRYANFVLIPESDFDIEGPHGFLEILERRILERKHAVIVVAEGAGQKYCQADGTDESGNPRLGDVGLYLKERITGYFRSRGIEINLKYIDPSYMIRSVPATADDSVFCGFLAQEAVHAGMSGKTNMVVGSVNDQFVYIPVKEIVRTRKHVDLNGKLWRSVLEATGQPSFKEEAAA